MTKSLLLDLHQPICLQHPAQHQKHHLLDTEQAISHLSSFPGLSQTQGQGGHSLSVTSYSHQHLLCLGGHTNSAFMMCAVLQSPSKGPALQDTAPLAGVTLPLALFKCLFVRLSTRLALCCK